jgi:hypothetical protein
MSEDRTPAYRRRDVGAGPERSAPKVQERI